MRQKNASVATGSLAGCPRPGQGSHCPPGRHPMGSAGADEGTGEGAAGRVGGTGPPGGRKLGAGSARATPGKSLVFV